MTTQAARVEMSESVHQARVVAHVRAKHPGAIIFAIPNGGPRHAIVAARLKAEGVTPGVPDLMIAEPRGRKAGLFVEMKKPGGRASAAQKCMIEQLNRRGYAAIVCVGFEDAIKEIEDYLEMRGIYAV